jgi:uncharacterized damage-inducible protein DinB
MKTRGKGGRAGGIAVLLHALDEAYHRNAWHGTTLSGSLKGLSAEQAAWRPAPGRHNIRELVVHAAYWKHLVRRRLTGERGSFPIEGSNWFLREDADEKAWRAEKDLLEEQHRLLRQAVASFSEARLSRPLAAAAKRTALREIAGVALHDVYHTGQIQLVKALARNGRG